MGAPAHAKVSRDDWLDAARDVLISEGAAQVKVLRIAHELEVSRSSFYWYFRDRRDLLVALLTAWDDTNTGIIEAHCAMPAEGIAEAILNLFKAFLTCEGFDHRLDFAVREWARWSGEVKAAVARADTARLESIAAMYARHGFGAAEADMRARVLYYMQIGYYALDLAESIDERLARVAGYVEGFGGGTADSAVLERFEAHVKAHQ